MQEKHSESQLPKMEGFLQKSFNKVNENTQKPVFWLVLCIFLIMGLAGYWIGSTMVVQSVESSGNFEILHPDTEINTILILEVDDLSLKKPQINSIWFVHLKNLGKSTLGFTPIVTRDQADNDAFYLLKNYSLDSNNRPSREFLKEIARKGFADSNFIILDQISTAAFVNWFSGKELTQPVLLSNHSMDQYGQLLRGFCSSLSLPSERGIIDFPWSRIIPGHFITSLNFNKVIENLAFLTSPNPPKCEMVAAP